MARISFWKILRFKACYSGAGPDGILVKSCNWAGELRGAALSSGPQFRPSAFLDRSGLVAVSGTASKIGGRPRRSDHASRQDIRKRSQAGGGALGPHPRRHDAGADQRDGDRSVEPVRDGAGERAFPAVRGQDRAEDPGFFERGRAALHWAGVRYQRKHGAEAPKVAPGGRAVLQDRQSGRRILPDRVQRPPGAGGSVHRRYRRDTESPGIRAIEGQDRACSMASTWR